MYLFTDRPALLIASIATSVIAANAVAADPKINFATDATPPIASANPLTLTGTTAGVGWTLKAQGTDLFNEPTTNGTGVYYTHNTASPGTTRGATFELTLSKPIYGLSFQVQDFGTRSINYGSNNSDVSGGEQTYTVAAFNGADVVDLKVGDGVAENLITLNDLGTSLGATSGVFDSQGTNIAGFDRDATYTFAGPTTRVLITTTDKPLTTALLGDNVSFANVTWPAVQVPEPGTLTMLGLVGALRRRRA